MEEKNNFEDELDFKSLIKSPSRLFGWIFPYYALLFLIVGIYFIKNMNTASFNSVPPNYTDSLEIDVDVAVKRGGIMPAVDLALISNPSADFIEKGKTLFITNCASCHGNEGKGDGVAAVALNPPPRNFHSKDGWTNGMEFSKIYSTVQKGVANTGMIAYEFLSVSDRIAMIQYIRTLSDYPTINDSEIAELDKTYELSKGEVSPNNITLEMAVNKISEENILASEELINILDKISTAEDKNSVILFDSFVSDQKKVISIFRRDYLPSNMKDLFISRIIASPVESGFKPSVASLSKERLSKLYDLLLRVIS